MYTSLLVVQYCSKELFPCNTGTLAERSIQQEVTVITAAAAAAAVK